VGPRKRGRPKGSKNKPKLTANREDSDSAEPTESESSDDSEDINLEMNYRSSSTSEEEDGSINLTSDSE
jgi:hypothetical protein